MYAEFDGALPSCQLVLPNCRISKTEEMEITNSKYMVHGVRETRFHYFFIRKLMLPSRCLAFLFFLVCFFVG